jgi:hypothetical protein
VHGAQYALPASDAKRPAAQRSQYASPLCAWNCPVAQLAQAAECEAAPAPSARKMRNFPGGQSRATLRRGGGVGGVGAGVGVGVGAAVSESVRPFSAATATATAAAAASATCAFECLHLTCATDLSRLPITACSARTSAADPSVSGGASSSVPSPVPSALVQRAMPGSGCSFPFGHA